MKKKYVIIGGVAGGATAAAKIRREDEHAEIVVYERGPYVSYANCGLPYYIGGEIKNHDDLLLMTPDSFWEKYRIKIFVEHEITEISPQTRKIKIKDHDGKEFADSYDTLILSQGANPVLPPLPGIDLPHAMSLRSVPDMDKIHHFINTEKPQSAVVVGGGFIGLEMAEALYHRGLSVTVVEMLPHILPPLDYDMATMFAEKIINDRLHIITNNAVAKIETATVTLKDNTNINAELVIMSAGVRPELELAKKAGLQIGELGGLVVNEKLQTSDPHIYAVGDMIEIKNRVSGKSARLPLAGPANRQARIAAINATGGSAEYHGALGTSIVKMFSLAMGVTGLNQKTCDQLGLATENVLINNNNHAGYYPNATPVFIKILYEKNSAQLLGAQVMGAEGVDKRLDVLATAIHAKMTLQELEELDLAYAPPFGSANDPVNIAGFVGTHIQSDRVKNIQFEKDLPENAQLIDVRNPNEIKATALLKGAKNIPWPQLRNRINELDPLKPVVLYCAKGYRGYLAHQVLKGNGFTELYNINGGFDKARLNGWRIA